MNQKRLYVLKARKLNCARRAAILLFTMMLTMTVQTAWAQDSGETNLVFPFTPTLVSAQPTNWDDSHYNAAKLFDGSYTGGGYGLSEGDVWVEFQFTDGIYPKGYALWTADNCLGSYNPKSWTLKAKKASGDAWTTLSTVDNTAGDKLPLANSTRAVFAIDNSEAYKYFRFEATKSDAGGFELSELKITSDQPNPYMQYASVTGLQDFYLYNDGSPIAINYAVTDALGHLLTKGTHYKETIRNSANQVVTELKEVGVYTLTIEGQNDLENQNSYFAYKGTKTLKFEIVNHKLPIKEVEYYGVPNIIVKREVVMSKTGRDVLELDGTIENIILFDEGYVNSYSNNCDGTLTIKAPRGYFLEVSGDISIEINDNLSIYDSDGINSSKLLGSYGPYFSRGMKCSSTGEYITFHFQSDGSGTSEGLYLNVNLVKIVPRSVEINIMGDGDKAPAEYGTFVSDKLMAVKGEPVTLTYTPNGDYELADMSVRGRVQGQLHEINYRVEEDDDMRWYTGKYTASFKMPENDVIVTTYFRIPNRFGYPIWAKVPKSGTKSITIPADVKEFDIYSTPYCEVPESDDDSFYFGPYEVGTGTGKLVLTAPFGCRLRIKYPSKIFTCPGDWVSIYNGPDVDYREVIYENYSGIRSIDPETGEENRSLVYIDMKRDWDMVYSKGRQMCVTFSTSFLGDGMWDGFRLVFEVVEEPYIVTFDANGEGIQGTVPEAQTVTQSSGFKVTRPADPVPEDPNLVFKGWYTDSGCRQLFDFGTPVDKDMKLFAGWTKQSTVHFESDHGTAPADQYITPYSGGKVAQPADPTDDNWVFTGWYADRQHVRLYNFDNLVKGDLTLYAGWVNKGQTCRAIYEPFKSEVFIPYGQEWTDIDVYVRYSSFGWFQNEGKPVREAVKLRFTPYVLSNDLLYFVNTTGNAPLIATPGAGEHVLGNKFDDVSHLSQRSRLWVYIPKSAWESAEPGEYVQYMPFDAVFFTYESDYPNSYNNMPPNESYYFYHTTGIENIQQVTFRLTVPESVTLTFDANGGNGTMDAASIRKGIATQLPECTFTNGTAGMAFLGWNTKADGTGTHYAPGCNLTTDTDLMLYAQWGDEYTLDLSSLQTNESVDIPFALSAQLTTLSGYFENLHYEGDEEGTDHLCLDVNLDGAPDVEWTMQSTVTGTDLEGYEIVEWTASAKKLAGAESLKANHRFMLMATEPGEYRSVLIKFSAADDAVTVLKPTIDYLYSDIDNRLEVIPALMNGQKHTVMLKDRTLYKDHQFNTLCLPFDVDDLDAMDANRESRGSDGVTFTGTPLERAGVYELDVEEEHEIDGVPGFKTSFNSDGMLYLFFKQVNHIEAGKPYLVRWAASSSNYSSFANPVFQNVFITSPTAEIENPYYTSYEDQYITAPVADAISFPGGKLVGTYGPTKIYSDAHDKYFFGSKNKINYPGNPEYTVGPFRAYLDFSESSSTVRQFVMKFGDDEETTGIKEIDYLPVDDLRSGASAWYDLNGCKLSGKPNKKGIYIRNGKKVVIK